MKSSRRNAFNNFGNGAAGIHVAGRELGMPAYAVKVAGSHGIGSAVEHIRETKAVKSKKRKAAKAARRVNR